VPPLGVVCFGTSVEAAPTHKGICHETRIPPFGLSDVRATSGLVTGMLGRLALVTMAVQMLRHLVAFSSYQQTALRIALRCLGWVSVHLHAAARCRTLGLSCRGRRGLSRHLSVGTDFGGPARGNRGHAQHGMCYAASERALSLVALLLAAFRSVDEEASFAASLVVGVVLDAAAVLVLAAVVHNEAEIAAARRW